MAQLAALGGALGAALVLLARGRLALLGGLALLAVAEAGLVLDLSDSGQRISPNLAALGAGGLVGMAVGAAILVRWPVLVTPIVLAAAPFRPPLSFGSRAPVLRRRRRARVSSAACCPSTACSAPPRSRSPGTRCAAGRSAACR